MKRLFFIGMLFAAAFLHAGQACKASAGDLIVTIAIRYNAGSTGLHAALLAVNDRALVSSVRLVNGEQTRDINRFFNCNNQIVEDTLKHFAPAPKLLIGAPAGEQVFTFVVDRQLLARDGEAIFSFGYYRQLGKNAELAAPVDLVVVKPEGNTYSCAVGKNAAGRIRCSVVITE